MTKFRPSLNISLVLIYFSRSYSALGWYSKASRETPKASLPLDYAIPMAFPAPDKKKFSFNRSTLCVRETDFPFFPYSCLGEDYIGDMARISILDTSSEKCAGAYSFADSGWA